MVSERRIIRAEKGRGTGVLQKRAGKAGLMMGLLEQNFEYRTSKLLADR